MEAETEKHQIKARLNELSKKSAAINQMWYRCDFGEYAERKVVLGKNRLATWASGTPSAWDHERTFVTVTETREDSPDSIIDIGFIHVGSEEGFVRERA